MRGLRPDCQGDLNNAYKRKGLVLTAKDPNGLKSFCKTNIAPPPLFQISRWAPVHDGQ